MDHGHAEWAQIVGFGCMPGAFDAGVVMENEQSARRQGPGHLHERPERIEGVFEHVHTMNDVETAADCPSLDRHPALVTFWNPFHRHQATGYPILLAAKLVPAVVYHNRIDIHQHEGKFGQIEQVLNKVGRATTIV